MKDVIKRIGKTALQGLIWVFVLSLNWNGRTLFSHANEVFVQNQVVLAADAQLADWWDQLKSVSVAAFRDEANKQKNGQM